MYICANMNALVLPIVIFTLSYLKWIKVLFVYLGFYIIMDDSIWRGGSSLIFCG